MTNWTWTGSGTKEDWETSGNWSNNSTASGYPGQNWADAVTLTSGAMISLSNETIGSIGTLFLEPGDISISGIGTLNPNNLDIFSGSTLELSSGVVVTINTELSMKNTGTAVISGGTIHDGDHVLTLAASQTLELTGDTSVTLGSATGVSNGQGVIVMNGGDLTFKNNAPTVMIDLGTVAAGTTGNTLYFPAYSTGINLTNLGYGDRIYAGGNELDLVANGDGTYKIIENFGSYTSVFALNVTLAPGVMLNDFDMSRGYLVYTGGAPGSVPCFYAGTMIATPAGAVAVEALRAGDRVLTADGRSVQMRWLGESVISTRFADRLRSLPIRIKAGALANGLPVRDLLVSPDHALFLGGVLVQAGALVNGISIVREADVPEIFSYYHVELESHELLMAEGVPAESFVDNVDRMNFQNWDRRAAPRDAIREMDYPRAKSARQVPLAVRREITVREAGFAFIRAA